MDRKDQKHLHKLAKRIKTIRTSQNLTQEQLAHKCGFDRTYISMLECGKRNPSYINLIKLCSGLKIEINNLLEA